MEDKSKLDYAVALWVRKLGETRGWFRVEKKPIITLTC